MQSEAGGGNAASRKPGSAYFFDGSAGTFSAPKMEEKVLAYWDEIHAFEKCLEKTKHGAPFTFYDGPPFATGLPHYGHILASTIKDVVPRYQTMKGRYVRRRWGWDCHGLPIEEIVERKLNISGKKQIEEIGIKKFNETCRSMVLTYAEEWGKMVRRIARWTEFENSYKTMDRDYMESVWWAFKQIYDKGLVYEGRKVLLYCPRCETPISNFEVAMDNSYQEVTEEAVTVKFRVTPGQKIGDWLVPENTFLLAWTTTPWTLPGNVALAVGKDIEYLILSRIVNDKKEFLIVAKATHEKPASATENQADFIESGLPIVYLPEETIKGADLVGLSYDPLFNVSAVQSDKTFKVYAADFVNTEEGTGVVHTAVVYGEDDYKLGMQEGLPVVPLLDEKGKFNDKAPKFLRGMYFKDAEAKIVADLEDVGHRNASLIFSKERHTHSYPHCWRCGTMLFYNAIPAWFINIQKIKKDLLASNNKEINWFPDHLKHGRYEKSVEAAPDWNISRNRYWGNPIPVWRCEECKKPTVVGSLAEIKEKSTAKNTYYFLRHGEADNVVADIVGPQDTPAYTSHLTANGKEQIARVAEALAAHGVDLIIASPLARAKETAEIVAARTGAPIEYREELKDIDNGVLNGKPVAAWYDLFSNRIESFTRAADGGETRSGAKRRIARVVGDLERSHKGRRILVVSHADMLWLLRGALQGLSNEEILKLPYPKPGELYEFAWSPLPLNDEGNVDLHRPYIDGVELECGHCGGRAKKISEIFDSWVEAGSMPFSEYHYPFENKQVFESRFPAQFVAEYIAQTRAWFYVMHVISLALRGAGPFGKAPFENVVTTGTILAEDESKMSKSKNNFPDPWIVIEKYGADSLRFYLMNSVVMQADNLNFNLRDLETVHRKVVMILQNVYNYFSTYAKKAGWRADAEGGARSVLRRLIGRPAGKKGGEKSGGNVLDKWIVARTKELVADVAKYMDAYDTVWATRVITTYIDDLSTWYLRRSRGRNDKDFFDTLYRALIAVSQVIAPFMPYLAEAIYLSAVNDSGGATGAGGVSAASGGAESVHLTDWPKTEALANEEKDVLRNMKMTREAASLGHMFRKSKNVPVRQPLAKINVSNLPPEYANLVTNELNIESFDPDLKRSEGIEEIEAPNGMKIFIDSRLTPDLLKKGYVRAMERFVQELRKKQGFKVGEQTALRYDTEDEKLRDALARLNKEKTYVSEIKEGGTRNGEVFEINEMKIVFALERS